MRFADDDDDHYHHHEHHLHYIFIIFFIILSLFKNHFSGLRGLTRFFIFFQENSTSSLGLKVDIITHTRPLLHVGNSDWSPPLKQKWKASVSKVICLYIYIYIYLFRFQETWKWSDSNFRTEHTIQKMILRYVKWFFRCNKHVKKHGSHFQTCPKLRRKFSIHNEADDWSPLPCPFSVKTPKDLLLRRILCHSLLGHYDIALQAPKRKTTDPGPFCEVMWGGRSFRPKFPVVVFCLFDTSAVHQDGMLRVVHVNDKEGNKSPRTSNREDVIRFWIDVQLDVGDLAKIPWTLQHPMMCACRAQGDREGWLAHSSSGACIEEMGFRSDWCRRILSYVSMYRIRSSPPENERM